METDARCILGPLHVSKSPEQWSVLTALAPIWKAEQREGKCPHHAETDKCRGGKYIVVDPRGSFHTVPTFHEALEGQDTGLLISIQPLTHLLSSFPFSHLVFQFPHPWAQNAL